MTECHDDSEARAARSLLQEHDLFGGFIGSVQRAEADARSRPLAILDLPPGDAAEFPVEVRSREVEAAARTGTDAARCLADALRHGSITERDGAHRAIAEMIHTLAEPYRGRVVAQPHIFTRIGVLEERLRRFRLRIPQVRWSPRFAGLWTGTGFLISIAAAIGIVGGYFVAAMALIVLRTAISLTLPTPGFASDGDGTSRSRVDWRACVIGQVSDAVVLAAVSGYLLVNDYLVLGLVTAFVPIASLGATLLRLAASQGGVVLGRMYVERVARNGTLVVWLLIAAGIRWFGVDSYIAAVVVATSGAAVFAIVETLRTLVYSATRQELDRKNGRDEAFTKRLANVVPLVDAAVKSTAPTSDGHVAA